MALVRLHDVSFTYGGEDLLHEISLQIEGNERIGLMGRNGAGKSTLMKLIAGELRADSGDVERSPGLKIARLAQEVPRGEQHTVFAEVASGLGEQGEILARIHELTHLIQFAPDQHPEGGPVHLELDQLQHKLDPETGWKMHQQTDDVIARMGLDPLVKFETLSSGMKRRVLLARALVCKPDILLLDEPTNHLDLEAIRWLEDFLLRETATVVFVTHDRMFLQRLANRIVEVDRARLFDWTCDYSTFLTRKAAAMEAEAQQEALFDKKLAEEEVWVRQGVKARRTRNQGRVRELEKMREARRVRRQQVGDVKLLAQEAERSGMLVLSTQGVNYSYGNQPILKDLTTIISRGDKVGIIGPNGAGKTTLLRILLGELKPQQGTMRFGTKLQVAYFDQLRDQLEEDRSAADNVAEGKDTVLIEGQSRHVIGYLQDFLFSRDRARTLVKYLSGGERNRLMLARMFTKPSNLLVLDEPTNDLDAETLELLEAMLVEYPGTLLLVSHDRAFLNNVVTSTLVFEGKGVVQEYTGGYDDWMRMKGTGDRGPGTGEKASGAGGRSAGTGLSESGSKARKLSNKEQRELARFPSLIESLETEVAQFNLKLAEPSFYQQSGPEIAKVTNRLATLNAQLQTAYQRWEELESA